MFTDTKVAPAKYSASTAEQFVGKYDLLALHRLNPERYPFLLESVAKTDAQYTAGTVNNARYDLLFAFPGEQMSLQPDGALSGGKRRDIGNDFLNQLDAWWQTEAIHNNAAQTQTLPFQGGWFIYLGYELAEQIEPRLQLKKQQHGLPIASATRVPAAIIYDHTMNTTRLVTEPGCEHLLTEMHTDLQAIQKTQPIIQKDAGLCVPLIEDDPLDYLQGVKRVKKYILEGDVFQVNLSRAWRGACPVGLTAEQIYTQLRNTNPAPFSGLARFPQGAIISSSPERLVKVTHGHVQTRPIAGTRPRGSNAQTDDAYCQELMAHPKERAEHIMLIDLERNDLGRICVPGTVRVDEFMVHESYAHVHHIVSNVQGQLRDDVTPGQVLRAVFPGGTITGCPKERCMAIIAELEQEARGAYTGAMGYLNHNGDMDMNILIRTIVMDDGTVSLRAGAGLVADSIAEKELEETRDKAKGLLQALGVLH